MAPPATVDAAAPCSTNPPSSPADPTTIPPATLHHLDTTSAGSLHTLLSNRSLANLKQLDYPAACSDAALSIRASPSFAKGHLRLLAALDAMSAPISERRGVVQEALQVSK